MSQVLDELGLNLSDELSSKKNAASSLYFSFHHSSNTDRFWVSDLPSTGGSLSVAGGKKAEPQAALADADADLEERLNNLRRDWTGGVDVDIKILQSLCPDLFWSKRSAAAADGLLFDFVSFILYLTKHKLNLQKWFSFLGLANSQLKTQNIYIICKY